MIVIPSPVARIIRTNVAIIAIHGCVYAESTRTRVSRAGVVVIAIAIGSTACLRVFASSVVAVVCCAGIAIITIFRSIQALPVEAFINGTAVAIAAINRSMRASEIVISVMS